MTAPRLPVLDTNYVAETAATGTVIGRVTVSDPDGDLLTVSLVDAFGDTDLASAFALVFDPVALNYTVVVRDASKINYETMGGTIHLRIKVADATQAVIKDFPITIVDVNEAPTDIVLSNRSVEEHAAAGTWIATISGTDQDAGDVLSYALKDAATSPFAIVQNASGVYELRVKDGSLIDYATDPDKKIDVTVVASDKYGLTTEKTFALDILDVNHPPTDILLENSTVLEHTIPNAAVGRLSAVDPDSGETFTYSLIDDAGGRFKIVDNILRVADGLKIDFEQQKVHNLKVLVTDSGGKTFEKTFIISVRNADVEVVHGSSGDDLIVSGDGDDFLGGETGNDTLASGGGTDVLTGGAGHDVFLFNTGSTGGIDIITDFNASEDQMHLLSYNEFFFLGERGQLPDGFFHVGTTALTALQRILYDRDSGNLYYDLDGSGNEFDPVLFAILENRADLRASHFFVV
jgi:uncharacterized lipoprotein YbaY